MAAIAKIDPNGVACSWSISVSNLKVGVYRAVLFDSKDTAVETWSDQRTDDNLPDTFPINTPPSQLPGAKLWWECIVSDPRDKGGPYVCSVWIMQGSPLCQDPASSEVPPGNGKLDVIGDQVSFA